MRTAEPANHLVRLLERGNADGLRSLSLRGGFIPRGRMPEPFGHSAEQTPSFARVAPVFPNGGAPILLFFLYLMVIICSWP
jgi:hypothetical protein